MAAVVTVRQRRKLSNGFAIIADVAMDNSYPTGGEAVTTGQFGLEVFDFVLGAPSGGYVPEFDHANKKLKVFYGDNNNVADGPLIEVPNTTDLAAVTFRVVAFGY